MRPAYCRPTTTADNSMAAVRLRLTDLQDPTAAMSLRLIGLCD